MREKIALFCDLNSISPISAYQDFSDLLLWNRFEHCVVYNTYDFLVQWIRDHHMNKIDDEHFFQIGDIGSEQPLKLSRPHLDAVENILSDIQSSTIYVIDAAAKIAYTHVHWSRDAVEKKLTEKWSAIFTI